jgi:hypothetical protein
LAQIERRRSGDGNLRLDLFRHRRSRRFGRRIGDFLKDLFVIVAIQAGDQPRDQGGGFLGSRQDQSNLAR